MAEYVNELIGTVIACRIVTMAAPDGELRRRYLGAVCALVTLLTLISPLRQFLDHAEEIGEAAAGFISSAEQSSDGVDCDDGMRGELGYAADVIFEYARDRYGFDTEGAEIAFATDDGGEVTDLTLYLLHGSVADCGKLRDALTDELGIEVHVFTGDVEDGTEKN